MFETRRCQVEQRVSFDVGMVDLRHMFAILYCSFKSPWNDRNSKQGSHSNSLQIAILCISIMHIALSECIHNSRLAWIPRRYKANVDDATIVREDGGAKQSEQSEQTRSGSESIFARSEVSRCAFVRAPRISVRVCISVR
ncbi:hypothetical protein PSP6_280094 [Paraburkholderia tropica]|nr:hypothetical protein PSP6_280094 [Paraburkholderia tropica]